jgi:hypothetical protein
MKLVKCSPNVAIGAVPVVDEALPLAVPVVDKAVPLSVPVVNEAVRLSIEVVPLAVVDEAVHLLQQVWELYLHFMKPSL